MNYKVFLERKAQKQLEGIPEPHQSRIRDKLIQLRDTGFSSDLDIRKLKGYRNYYRMRIGTYRVLFEVQEGYILVVLAVLPRGQAY